jgi:predicted nucleotidyltransferase component of viral defense system
MDKDFAIKLASEIGVDAEQVIREEAELIVLKELFASPFYDRLVFKGGTALRLVYGSFRFSEDLDFSITKQTGFSDFRRAIERLAKKDERFSIKDLAAKYYTYLAQIRVKESWRESAFSIKIEVSRRVVQGQPSDYVNMLAKSPATNVAVMVRTFTLEKMLAEKFKAIKERKMPRDIFDIWFISQKINQPFDLINFGYPKGRIRRELRKFLPSRFYPVVEELEKLNAQGI